MKIDHIALYVNDLEVMKDFYITYFGATASEKYHNPKTGLQTCFLSFTDGGRIEIMTKPGVQKNLRENLQEGYVHIALSVEKKEQVDKLTSWLVAEGYQVLSGPRTTGDGYYESCILDPERNQIEITV